MPDSNHDHYLSRPTALRLLLLTVLAAVVWLLSPYFRVLVVAGITAVLATPLHVQLLRRMRNLHYLAAVLTTTALTLGVFVPLGLLAWLLSRELLDIATPLVAALREGGLDHALAVLDSPRIAALLDQLGVDRQQLASSVADAVQQVTVTIAGALASSLPDVVTQSAQVIFDVLVFFFSVVTLLARGPALLRWLGRVSPLDPRYQQRLFDVFTEFARNVVVAGLVCGLLQGAVAGIGYAILGIDRPFLLGVFTGGLTFVPFVGTALVWVPVALQLLMAGSWGKALFVLGWSVLITSSVDNVVRPFIVRGQSGIHPLLILLGVLGGLRWLGIVGVLIGPVLVAMLVTLLTLYTEEVAPEPPPAPPSPPPSPSPSR